MLLKKYESFSYLKDHPQPYHNIILSLDSQKLISNNIITRHNSISLASDLVENVNIKMSSSGDEMQVSDSESLQSSNFSSAATVIIISDDDDDEVQIIFENHVPPESSEEEEIRVEFIRFINPPESTDEILRPVPPVQS